MRVPVASVYRTGGVGGLVGCVGVAASAPTVHHHHIDHDEEQISRLAHHLSQISSDHEEGLQVCMQGLGHTLRTRNGVSYLACHYVIHSFSASHHPVSVTFLVSQ